MITNSALDSFRRVWRLYRSGIFDAKQYRRVNPDIGYYPAHLHIIRHGDSFGREDGQTARTSWMVREVASGLIPIKLARKLMRADIDDLLPLIDQHGAGDSLSVGALLLTKRWKQGDVAKARSLVLQTHGAQRVVAAHLFASRRCDLSLAPGALEEGLQNLATLEANVLRKLLDLATALGRYDVFRTIGHALLHKCSQSRTPLQAQAFMANMPWLETVDTIGLSKALDSLGFVAECGGTPRRDSLKLLSEFYQTLLTLASANGVGLGPFVLFPESARGSRVRTLHDVTGSERARIIRVRLMMPNYWVPPQSENTVTGGALDVQKAFLKACRISGVPVLPTFATPIYDITTERNWGLPALSYHTFSRDNESPTLHYKEGYLPGYFGWDTQGYSGWSSIADTPLSDLPSYPDANRFVNSLRDRYVKTGVTKYAPTQMADSATARLPDEQFLFAALQVPDDTVAALAWVSREAWLETLADFANARGIPLVVKAHPKDASTRTLQLLERVRLRGGLVSAAPVHELISRSLCVVTVNSGVGFEALLHPRPVVTLGACDYAAATLPARNLEELNAQLQRAIAGQGPSKASVKRVVAILLGRRSWFMST